MSTTPVYKTVMDLDVAGAKTGQEVVEVIQDGQSKRMTLQAATAVDVMDYKINLDAVSPLELNKQQAFVVKNDTATPKAISLSAAPALRSATYVVIIEGKAGAVTWPANVAWHAGVVPELGTTKTFVILFWDGVSFTGSAGPTY